jgi:hypothetical protein
MTNTEKDALKHSIEAWRDERNKAQILWSLVHHSSLFGSIICSISAGAVLQITNNQTLASILTSVAAVLTGIASSGGFERKWSSNRLSRSAADRILVDMESDDVDMNSIRNQYKLAIENHDLQIVGNKNGGAS